MIINPEIKSLLVNMSNVMCEASKFTFLYNTVNGWLLAQSYDGWLLNGIIEDMSAMTCLLASTSQVENITVRPIHCIIRSTMEKYADLVNLCTRQNRYEEYLWFLRDMSERKYSDKDEVILKRDLRNQLNVKKIDRKTRYYLLGRSKYLFGPMIQILEFNQKLSSIDNQMSSILHNNVQEVPKNSMMYIDEILQYMLCMAYGAMYAMSHCYQWGGIDEMILNSIHSTKVNLDYHRSNGTVYLQ